MLDLPPLSLSSAPPQVDCTSMALLQVTNLPRSFLLLHIFPAETSHHPSIQTTALRNKAEQHSDKSSESSQRLINSPSNSRTFISQAASASPSPLLPFLSHTEQSSKARQCGRPKRHQLTGDLVYPEGAAEKPHKHSDTQTHTHVGQQEIRDPSLG